MTSLVTLLILFGFAGPAQPQRATIRLDAAFGYVDVTFDPSRLPRAEVERWMQLSPHADGTGEFLNPEIIPQYFGAGLSQVGCGRLATQKPANPWLLDKLRSRIRSLEPAAYPAGLRNVVLHVRDLQSFGLWMDSQVLAFMKDCGPAPLEASYGGIDLEEACAAPIRQVAEARSPFAKGSAVQLYWVPCSWTAWRRKHPYPADTWRCFLASQGIVEHMVYTDGWDDP
ncbi:MAG: hypothetical protein KGM47_00410 [Acidobacteriota bacterium]|nr:hypothetical protein [Acidobacteriota bacterium]